MYYRTPQQDISYIQYYFEMLEYDAVTKKWLPVFSIPYAESTLSMMEGQLTTVGGKKANGCATSVLLGQIGERPGQRSFRLCQHHDVALLWSEVGTRS